MGTPTILSGLPPDILAAINPTQSQYDSGPGQVPSPQVPMRPAGQLDVASPEGLDGMITGVTAGFLQHVADIQKRSPLAQKVQAQKAQEAQQPQQPAGGSFGDKLKSAANNFGASMGDAAAATEKLPQGVGGLGGVERTLAARSQRLRAEKNDQMLSALNNMQMAVQQQRLDKDKQEMQDHVFASNATSVKAREDAGYHVEHAVPENVMTARMNDYKGTAEKPHYGDVFDAIPTGVEDINGKKVKMFDIVQRTSEPVTPSDAEINFIKNNGGPDLTGVKPTNAQLTSLRLAAQRDSIFQKQMKDATGRDLTDEQNRVLDADKHSDAVQHAMADVPGDRIGGVITALATASDNAAHAQMLLGDAQQHGDPDAIKEIQDHITQLGKEQKSLQNVAAFGFSKEDYADHKARVEELDKRNVAAETKRHNMADEANKAAEIAAKKSASVDDISAAAEGLRKGRQDPSQLSKRSATYQATLNEADRQEMQETGQHFNIAQASTDYKFANNIQTKNTLNMANAMTDQGGSIEIAQTAAHNLPRVTNEKTLNKLFALGQGEFGDPTLSDFHTAMLGLADEYSKVMGGGVSSDTGRQQALDLLKQSYSHNQTDSAIAIMRKDIAARKSAIIGNNRYLKQEYGVQNTQQPNASASTQPPANAPAGAITRPAEFPSAVATKDFKGKDGVTRTYWVDAEHKPLGVANVPKD